MVLLEHVDMTLIMPSPLQQPLSALRHWDQDMFSLALPTV